jgi:hypothetical protein
VVGALNGFLDLPAAEATSADPDPPGRTIDHCADTLKIGVERPFGFVVGVTDVMAGLMLFRTDIT